MSTNDITYVTRSDIIRLAGLLVKPTERPATVELSNGHRVAVRRAIHEIVCLPPHGRRWPDSPEDISCLWTTGRDGVRSPVETDGWAADRYAAEEIVGMLRREFNL